MPMRDHPATTFTARRLPGSRLRGWTASLVALALAATAARAGAAPPAGDAPAWLWWEAERPKATNFPNRNPFAPADEKAGQALSGGGWLGAQKPATALFIVYEVAVPKAGTFTLYARKFWRHGPFKWRFDDEPWRNTTTKVALLDDVPLTSTVRANWVELGKSELGAGKHTLRIEVDAGVEAVAFDCFVLTEGAFTPRGPLKTGVHQQSAPEGWFAFDPDSDHATRPAPLDLRFLNEAFSGENGVIQARGDSFVHEKTGTPVRFWAVNADHDILDHDPATMNRFARRLARVGVNMVRLHGPLWRENELARIDDNKLIKIHALVAALKTEGIYLTLSTYFPLWMKPAGQPGFEGLEGDAHPFALPFFNPHFQNLQKGWWKAALTRPNAATGLSLAQDPTLAFIELVNEDGLLFWTFNPYQGIPEQQMAILEKQFGDWLKQRYGGIDKAFAAWGTGGIFARWFGGMVKGDDTVAGRVGFMALDQIVEKKDKRAQDTAEFLAATQRTYFDRMYSYLKKDLGFRGAVSCSNWTTADPQILGPLDKVSNARCDFMDRHGHFAGPHQRGDATVTLSSGDRFNDAAAVRFETGNPDAPGPSFNLPIMDLAYNGKPSINSELNWVLPNRFRADMALLVAAYGALQGSDGFSFHTTRGADWTRRLDKFSVANPVVMGQFPAAALIFRKGLVRTAAPAVHLETTLANLHALNGIDAIDPLAYLVGRVEVNASERGGQSRVSDLRRFIDRSKSVVRSSTGELRWDYGQGVVTVDAPAAQGVTGFLARAGVIALGDIQVSSPLEYGTILVVAMDDLPIKTSRRLLIQVMSEDTNSGWSAPGTGMRAIAEVGGPPIIVKKLGGKLIVRRPDSTELKVTPLDFNGRPTVSGGGQRLSTHDLNLLPTTIHYLVEKPEAPPAETLKPEAKQEAKLDDKPSGAGQATEPTTPAVKPTVK